MFKIYKKDLKLFFTDRKARLLTFVLPVILISLFALAYGGISGNSKTKPILLPVADMDKTEVVGKIIAKLDSIKGLKIEPMGVAEAQTEVHKGKRIGVLIFYKGFNDSVEAGKTLPMELQYDEGREMEIGMLQSVLIYNLMKSVGAIGVKHKIKSFIHDKYPDMSQSKIDTIMNNINSDFSGSASGKDKKNKNKNKVSIGMDLKTTSIVGKKEEGNLGLIQAVAGTAIMMLLFSVAGLGAGLIEEKEAGTLKKLLYSPINSSDILYGKMLAGFTISVIQLSVMFIFSKLVFGLHIGTNIPALILMIIATAFACSSFGIFLASVASSRKQVQSLSTIIILIMSAIGGSMVPLFFMPAIMQTFAVISVNYWGIQGFYDIFWRHLPLTDVMPKILILTGIGLFVTAISIFMYRKNVLKMI